MHPPLGEPPHWVPAGIFHETCFDKHADDYQAPPRHAGYKQHTNTIERNWRNLKEFLRTTNNVNTAQQCIGEWMHKKNILNEIIDTKDRLQRFLQDVTRVYPGLGKNRMKCTMEKMDICNCHECEEYFYLLFIFRYFIDLLFFTRILFLVLSKVNMTV